MYIYTHKLLNTNYLGFKTFDSRKQKIFENSKFRDFFEVSRFRNDPILIMYLKRIDTIYYQVCRKCVFFYFVHSWTNYT